ncbi:uncharacterized protein LOC118430209 [Branchiostoma floridae]|uniref:Uncharacterized protein LOC118430209 n=1 Tax=Branchiostoma floridae TaxID=7739 RepID=A0A9J7N870_BRAFL|nr:uncharacterized protein LOC118430209 [Branchiostoma floridae]
MATTDSMQGVDEVRRGAAGGSADSVLTWQGDRREESREKSGRRDKGVRVYRCEECSKEFSKLFSLKRLTQCPDFLSARIRVAWSSGPFLVLREEVLIHSVARSSVSSGIPVSTKFQKLIQILLTWQQQTACRVWMTSGEEQQGVLPTVFSPGKETEVRSLGRSPVGETRV